MLGKWTGKLLHLVGDLFELKFLVPNVNIHKFV